MKADSWWLLQAAVPRPVPEVAAAVATATAGGYTSPEPVMATGAAKEIHESGNWRQGTRAGAHEKSSDYAQRIMTDMPLHDALVRSQFPECHKCLLFLLIAASDYAQRIMTDMPLHNALVRFQVPQWHRCLPI